MRLSSATHVSGFLLSEQNIKHNLTFTNACFPIVRLTNYDTQTSSQFIMNAAIKSVVSTNQSVVKQFLNNYLRSRDSRPSCAIVCSVSTYSELLITQY